MATAKFGGARRFFVSTGEAESEETKVASWGSGPSRVDFRVQSPLLASNCSLAAPPETGGAGGTRACLLRGEGSASAAPGARVSAQPARAARGAAGEAVWGGGLHPCKVSFCKIRAGVSRISEFQLAVSYASLMCNRFSGIDSTFVTMASSGQRTTLSPPSEHPVQIYQLTSVPCAEALHL